MTQTRHNDSRQHRLDIRRRMMAAGRSPYPQEGHRSHLIAQAQALPPDRFTIVCGRIRAIRGHGKVQFIDLEDSSGTIQIVLKADHTAQFDLLNELDTGDFIRVHGVRLRTHSGEESIQAERYDMLAKTLRPLPDSHYGFTDEEGRYRRRYLDLMVNPTVRQSFVMRSRILSSIRQTLETEGFMEVETPTLQPLYGGANARPFVTRINAFDGMEMFLKISDELYLKRLVVGGFEKVYEIDKDFRNEGVSQRHNPEFTMMECYAAYWDYEDMMRLTETLYRNAALAATGNDMVPYDIVRLDEEQ